MEARPQPAGTRSAARGVTSGTKGIQGSHLRFIAGIGNCVTRLKDQTLGGARLFRTIGVNPGLGASPAPGA